MNLTRADAEAADPGRVKAIQEGWLEHLREQDQASA
jgi:hypothetical protein